MHAGVHTDDARPPKLSLTGNYQRENVGSRSNFGSDNLVAYSLQKGNKMLETIIVILVVLWLLGFATANTFGGFVHILLVVAVAVLLVRLLSGRKAA